MPSPGFPGASYNEWRQYASNMWTTNATIDSVQFNYGPVGGDSAEVTMRVTDPSLLQSMMGQQPPAAELGPLEWLRSQVDEMCVLAREL
jgi:hypothetical protein